MDEQAEIGDVQAENEAPEVEGFDHKGKITDIKDNERGLAAASLNLGGLGKPVDIAIDHNGVK